MGVNEFEPPPEDVVQAVMGTFGVNRDDALIIIDRDVRAVREAHDKEIKDRP
jgi:hypothetical protein